MSHENSETIQDADGRWYNVHGQTRQPLAPRLSTERSSYGTVEEAVEQAKLRSKSWNHPQTPRSFENRPPLPPIDRDPNAPSLLEVLRVLLLGQNVGEPGGPSMGMLPFVPGLGAASSRVRGLAPRLWRAIQRSPSILDPVVNPAAAVSGGASSIGVPSVVRAMEDALARASQQQAPFVSPRTVPATTPTRERLANPLPDMPGKTGWNPGEPGLDEARRRLLQFLSSDRSDRSDVLAGVAQRAQQLTDRLDRPVPPRATSPKQLALLDEIKMAMQRLLKTGLPAPNEPRQLLPPEMARDLAQRYGTAADRAKDALRGRGVPRARLREMLPRYDDSAATAVDLGAGTFSDKDILNDMVEEIVMRLLGKRAGGQRAIPLDPVTAARARLVPRTAESEELLLQADAMQRRSDEAMQRWFGEGRL